MYWKLYGSEAEICKNLGHLSDCRYKRLKSYVHMLKRTRQAGVDKQSLLIVNLFVNLCPIYLPLS